jgi:hypothetical protein
VAYIVPTLADQPAGGLVTGASNSKSPLTNPMVWAWACDERKAARNSAQNHLRQTLVIDSLDLRKTSHQRKRGDDYQRHATLYILDIGTLFKSRRRAKA